MDGHARSPAPMRFLARLAPAARRAAPGVRAALPSRFAPGNWEEPVDEQAVEATVNRVPVAAQTPPTADTKGESPAAPVTQLPPATVVLHKTITRLDPQALRAPTPAAPLPHSLAVARDNAAEPARAQPLQREDEGTAPVLREAFSGRPSEAAQPVLKAAPRPFADLSRPAGDVRPPLSESTVAERGAATRGTETVVHVTIDRIDVRAPAGRTEQQQRPRTRSSPSISLSEYLRQRDQARRGGSA
jgi:hypothetical protein